MPIDPGLQTPENYMTPAQLQAQREYAKFLMEQSHGEVRSPAQGMANVARALMGGWEAGRADTNERQGRKQYSDQMAQALLNPQNGLGGAVGAITSPWATPEGNKMLTEALVPKLIQGPEGTYAVNPLTGGNPRLVMPGVEKDPFEVAGVKGTARSQFNPRTGQWESRAMLPPVPGAEGGGPPQAPMGSGPSPSTVNPASVGGQPQNLTGPIVPPPRRPGEPMVGQPGTASERVAQGHNSVSDWAAVGSRIEAERAGAKKTAEKVADIYATKADRIEKQAFDAQGELPQLEMLKKVISNPQFSSGLFSGEVGALDQIGKMLGISTGQTASLQQLASKLGSAGSLEQIREMGQQGAVRVPEMHMIEKSNFDPKNTPEANMAVVELRARLAQRSIEMADMANKYASTGSILGEPGRGSGGLDRTFDQQVRDHYRDKPLISDPELARYEALATRPSTKEGIGAPIAGGPLKVADKASYDALPKGTPYIAPDGSQRTKQ